MLAIKSEFSDRALRALPRCDQFIRYPRLGREFDELYDLMSDPYELENQIGNAEYSPQLETLERQLDRLLESIPDNSGR